MVRFIPHQTVFVLLLLLASVYADTKSVYQGTNDATELQDMTVNQGVGADTLWEALCDSVPPGVSNLSAIYCDTLSYKLPLSGTFTNMPAIDGVRLKDGIIMTSGYANNCLGPNENGTTSQEHGWPGDGDLQNVVGQMVMDAATFSITFTSDATINGISFMFCFGSEEYPEYIGHYNDVFICLLDGQNICFDSQDSLISASCAFITVDNQNNQVNLEYDGLTSVLQTSRRISPGNHTVKFAIGDTRDQRLDSGVFLAGFKFDTTMNGTCPVVNIVENHVFEISENTPPQTVAGTVTNLCKYGPVTILDLSSVDEFTLSGWNITVADGAVFDADVQDTYVMTIQATLDTVWNANPWLFRDTAKITIKILASNSWPEIARAVIHDENGNGIGDSVHIVLKGRFPDHYDLTKAEFSWPEGMVDYSAALDASDLQNDTTITFSYDPGSTATIWTTGQSTIALTIDSLGSTSTHSAKLSDGIGPVLAEAFVVERVKPQADTFRVRLSEPIAVSAITGNSFILIKKDQVKEIEIGAVGSVTNLEGESFIEFLVADLLVDAPAPGDSLRILHTGPVKDKKDNSAHNKNAPVPIQFITNTGILPETGDTPFSVSAFHIGAERITVRFCTEVPRKFTALLYNLSGRCIQKISEYRLAGKHSIQFVSEGLPNGSYICRIKADKIYEENTKIVLMR